MSQRARSLTAEMFHLAWPVLVAQLAVMANGVVDTVMAGRLGAIDLAAVGIGTSVYMTMFVAAMGVLLAVPPIVARLHGAGRHAEIGEEVRQSLWLALALGAAVILVLRHPEPLLALARLAPPVEAKVRAYLEALSWSVPAALLFRVFYGFSTGIGQPRPVMVLNLAGVAAKVPANAIFMYGGFGMPALGAPGCAVATSLVSWLLCLTAWGWSRANREYAGYALFARFSAPRWRILRQLLALGVPIGATFLVDVTAFTMMALFIARLGAATSAAHQVAANVAVVLYMVPLSLGNAAGVLAAHALGGGDARRAQRAGRLGLAIGLALAFAAAGIVAAGASGITALYTGDPGVAAIAAGLLPLVACYHLADALQAVAINILRAYKKTTVPMLAYALTLWGVGLGGGYLLGLSNVFGAPRGAAGFWMGQIGGLALAGIIVAGYFGRVASRSVRASPTTV